MRYSVLVSFVPILTRLTVAVPTSTADHITSRAERDGIDLSVLDIAGAALAAIAETYKEGGVAYGGGESRKRAPTSAAHPGVGEIIDVHAHAIPAWYHSISPYTGGNPDPLTGGGTLSPVTNVTAHLKFMETIGISHSILGFSGPSANAYFGDKARTAALARLINEQLAAMSRVYPEKFNFFAAIPLPYTDEAIVELKYAVRELGAVGVALMSNHEGWYLGDKMFTPFWRAVDELGGRQIVYVHPTTPWVRVNGTFVVANPLGDMNQSRMEFYMETARTFMDLTVKQAIHNFTNTHFILPHAGGAFPTMIDRVLKTVRRDLYDASLNIYRTRFWWDSASPTYYHQIHGLLGYGIPKANLLYGSDYPFISEGTTTEDLTSILEFPGLSGQEKTGLLSSNYRALFGDKLRL